MAAAVTERLTRPAWVVAGVAAMSVAAHIWMLAVHSHGALLTGLMIVMTLWCAWCAVEALLCPTTHCLQRLLLMSLAMVAVHTMMIVGPAQSGLGGHAHHAADTAASGLAGAAAAGHASAMLTIIAVEFLVAVVCALSLRRRRALLFGPQVPLLKEVSI